MLLMFLMSKVRINIQYNNLNFNLFLTQNYHMSSAQLEYSHMEFFFEHSVIEKYIFHLCSTQESKSFKVETT